MNDLSMKTEKQEQDKKAQKRKAEEDKLAEMQIDCKRLKNRHRSVNRQEAQLPQRNSASAAHVEGG